MLLTMARLTTTFSLGQLNILVFQIELKRGYIKPSPVSDHLLECDCSIDFDNFDILATNVSKLNLLIKEILLIKHDKPVLNRTVQLLSIELFQ